MNEESDAFCAAPRYKRPGPRISENEASLHLIHAFFDYKTVDELQQAISAAIVHYPRQQSKFGERAAKIHNYVEGYVYAIDLDLARQMIRDGHLKPAPGRDWERDLTREALFPSLSPVGR